MAGRKAKPTAIRRLEGNRGKRAWNHAEPVPPDARPRCPEHLGPVARKEWRRLAHALCEMGVLTVVDRAALAAYCAAYGRWVEAEKRLQETPTLIRTPSGHVQQSPWMTSAAVVDSAADQRSGVFTCWRGNAAGLGGWTFVTRISLSTLQATGMAFFGLYGSTAAFATTLALSAVVSCIGIGFQRGTHTR